MHELMKLPYAYDALEPFMDARTVEIHHSKHHQGYVNKLNKALEGHDDLMKLPVEELLKDLDKVPEDIRVKVRFNGGGVANHNLFWTMMKKGGSEPSGDVLERVNSDFGSFEGFKKEFAEKALSIMGSGWCWLVWDGRKLDILTTSNHETPVSDGKTPLLVCDMWEHSFYLKHTSNKKGYLDDWWNIVDWGYVDELFTKALK